MEQDEKKEKKIRMKDSLIHICTPSKVKWADLLIFGFIRIAGKAEDKRMRINHKKRRKKTNKMKKNRRKECGKKKSPMILSYTHHTDLREIQEINQKKRRREGERV